MFYIESHCTEPAQNLALEQFVFEKLPKNQEYLMLWQNRDAVIIGKYQNTIEEINEAYAKEHGIRVVRRMTGGGAVFHDLGNLNYSFICDAKDASTLNFHVFCQPVIDVLAKIGIHAEVSGRNDISIDGRKISGSAQYMRGDRVLHHGTLLFSVDLERMAAVLTPGQDKVESNGAKSVRSRVTNICDHLSGRMEMMDFWKLMKTNLVDAQNVPQYFLSKQEENAVNRISKERYETWEWNYGTSPDYSIKKTRRVPQCGTIHVGMEVEKGRIAALALRGDFFCSRDPDDVIHALQGRKLEASDLADALSRLDLGKYIFNLSAEELVRVLLE